MKIESVKQQLCVLAKQHNDFSDDREGFEKALLIEQEAEYIIFSWCSSKGYQVNGFPPKKRHNIEDETDHDNSMDRIRTYLDVLTTTRKNVAALTWLYDSMFFEGIPDTLEGYVEMIREHVAKDSFQNEIWKIDPIIRR